jgi:glucose/arabinose dehydrogenase
MIDEPSGEKDDQPHRKNGRGQNLLLILLIAVVMVAGAIYSLWDEIFPARPIPRITPTVAPSPTIDARVAGLHLPAGFHISIFEDGLNTPRFMTFGPDGTLFVAERGTNSIIAVLDPHHTGRATEKRVLVNDLDDPTNLIYYQGALYVGEQMRISRFALGSNLQVTSRQVIISNLPVGGLHTTRTVLIGPDGLLYVSIGSDCNVCYETDPHRASVWVYNLDGSDGHVYARGLRNTVGMAVNPWNNQLWVTNNGSDYEGYGDPTDTLYTLQAGNYGWPGCMDGDVIDTNYGHPGDCKGVIPPLFKLQAHSAPLGLAFYNADSFPLAYRGVFVALHGSFYPDFPAGYKVIFIPLNAQGQIDGPAQDFITGWLVNSKTGDVTGRPSGITVGPDGALYISDDKSGVIYRVTYTS